MLSGWAREARTVIGMNLEFDGQFGNYQNEIYFKGLSGVLPTMPMTFEELEGRAQAVLSPSLLSYVAGGAGDESTQRANVSAFQRWGYAADDGRCDSVDPLEQVADEFGETPGFFALYTPTDRALAESLVHRAAAAGFKGIVVTLDTWLTGWRPCDLAASNFPQLRGCCLANYTSDPLFRARLVKAPEDDMQAAVLGATAVGEGQPVRIRAGPRRHGRHRPRPALAACRGRPDHGGGRLPLPKESSSGWCDAPHLVCTRSTSAAARSASTVAARCSSVATQPDVSKPGPRGKEVNHDQRDTRATCNRRLDRRV
jgi:hypothetical protein